MKLVLRNCGTIDPEKIEEYIATGGYEALGKVVTLDPAEVIAAVKQSGLRGRGGGGVPDWDEVGARAGGGRGHEVRDLQR